MNDNRCPTRCDHDRLNDALSGEADAVRRAESAEMGCEIAYRREPTQAEGDAHEYRNDQSMGVSEAIGECHVPMGNHHGHRCLCGRWVWGGPTVCQQCSICRSRHGWCAMQRSDNENLSYLRDLLQLRQDKRYRMGLLQCAVSFGVITQLQWERFVWQVNAGRKAPKG